MTDKPPKPPRKHKSGWEKELAKREKERAALLARASELGLDISAEAAARAPRAPDEAPADTVRAAYEDVGPPPNDPIEAIVWGNRMAALVAWDYAVGPVTQHANMRRKGILEAIRSLGMTNSKAVDKKLMLKIAKSLGIENEGSSDVTEEDDGTPALRG